MKKIFIIPVVLCTILCSAAVFACTQDKAEVITGGACSIKELNLEKNKTIYQRTDLLPNGERDLRPVKLTPPTMPKSSDDKCLFGMCLYQRILEGK